MYFLIVLTVRCWLQENTIPVEFSHLCAGIVLECDGKIDPTKSPYIPKSSCPGNPPVPVAWYLSTIQIFLPSLVRTPSAYGSNNGPMQRRLDITNSTFRSTLYHVLLHILMHSVPVFQHHLAIFDKVIGI